VADASSPAKALVVIVADSSVIASAATIFAIFLLISVYLVVQIIVARTVASGFTTK
jgi:hypothetical protein